MTRPPAATGAQLTRTMREAYVARQLLARRAVLAARAAWQRINPDDIRGSWQAGVGDVVLHMTSAAQAAAADAAIATVTRMLVAQGIDPAARAQIDPYAFAGIASDGRDLSGLLELANAAALRQIATGTPVARSLAIAGRWLEMIVGTQVSDASRMATSVSTTTRTHVDGWYRVLNPPSCSRCAVLAGRWYRWDAGFARHPRCDCGQVPATDGALDDMPHIWSPDAYFESLTKAEQDRVFTPAGAAAIRAGADINQVVNARRGMVTASVGGRDVLATTVGTSRRGYFAQVRRATGAPARSPRLMPEQIYRLADGDRDEALRLLQRNGYVLGQLLAPRHHATGGDGIDVPPIGDGGSVGPPRELPSLDDLVPRDVEPSPDDRERVLEALRDVIVGQYGGLEIDDVVITRFRQDTLAWEATIRAPSGELAGRTMRLAYRDGDQLVVDHEYLRINDEYQGRGFSTAFLDAMRAWYRQSGVDRITIHAALSDGGFAWAMAGFDWEDQGDVLFWLRQAIARGDGTDAELGEARRVLRELEEGDPWSENYPTPRNIATIGMQDGLDDWFGRRVMRGSNWHGWMAP